MLALTRFAGKIMHGGERVGDVEPGAKPRHEVDLWPGVSSGSGHYCVFVRYWEA
jgi:hypothetical protein